jgi:hypothetical protein
MRRRPGGDGSPGGAWATIRPKVSRRGSSKGLRRVSRRRPTGTHGGRLWSSRGGTRLLFDDVRRSSHALGPLERGAFRQHRAWCLSTVWFHERWVLKASLPMWSHEPEVTRTLARLVPRLVPGVAACGALGSSRGSTTPWLLQARAPGAAPGDTPTERARLAHALGRLQVEVAGAHDELVDAGAPVRAVASLRDGVKAVLRSGELDELDDEARAALPALAEELTTRLDRLESLGPPLLLAHGDLHTGNALVSDDGVALIDWTDAALAPPGIDLATLVGFGEDPTSDAWRGVLDAYTDAVRPALGARAEEVVRAGVDVALAYHAVSYELIDRALLGDARWQLEGTIRYLVGRMLALQGSAGP